MKNHLMFLLLNVLWSILPCAAINWTQPLGHDGVFQVDRIRIYPMLAEKNWNWVKFDASTMMLAPGYPKHTDRSWEWRGTLNTSTGPVLLNQKFSQDASGALICEIGISCSAPLPTDAFGFQLYFAREDFANRNFRIGDREIMIPENATRRWMPVASGEQLRQCEFNFPGNRKGFRVLSDCAWLLQDNPVELRMLAFSGAKDITEAKVRFRLEDCSVVSESLDLSKIMNRGFCDELAGDRQGGWTDQGPQNDLSMMVPGKYSWGGIDFDIIDPSANNGKSVLVFEQGTPALRILNLNGKKYRYLCLQHATTTVTAGTRIGSLTVHYQDGTRTEHPVLGSENIGNWWGARSLPAAPVFWEGIASDGTLRGLYTWCFQVEEKPIERLEFSNQWNGKSSDWMIVALSGCKTALPKLRQEGHSITLNEHYRTLKSDKDIVPGSALDFSFFNEKPAGKHGWIISKNGHFEYERRPGIPVRLIGANICAGACFPDKELARNVARRFAAMGYNTVRMHQQDFYLQRKGSRKLDADMLDKMDYFFYCLKEEGIYVTTDLYAHRFNQGEIADMPGNYYINAFRSMALLNSSARRNWEEYAARLLNHVNPYTGIAYKDDPALFSLCLINEGNLERGLLYANYPPASRFFEQAFEKYLKTHSVAVSDEAARKKHWNDFLFDIQREAQKEMCSFLRMIGCRQQLTNLNMLATPRLTLLREPLDFVDNHGYWDHPTPIAPMPVTFSNRSSLEKMVSTTLGEWFPSRIFGKPFTVTEYNWCYPNRFRAESGPLIGAYAALQGYSALYRFSYAGYRKLLSNREEFIHSLDMATEEGKEQISTLGIVGAFDMVNDPILRSSDRIATLLFRRGDVAESQLYLPIRVRMRERDNTENWPTLIKQLGFCGKTGCVIEQPDGTFVPEYPMGIGLSGDVSPYAVPVSDAIHDFKRFGEAGAAKLDPPRAYARSSTGEVELDGKASCLRVITPRSETLVVNHPGKLTGRLLSVETDTSAVFCAAAMETDAIPLATSKRILFFHLTNVVNSGIHFANRNETVLDHYGSPPLLVTLGKAKVQLQNVSGRNFRIFPLRQNGSRQKEIKPDKVEAGTLSFTVDNQKGEEAPFIYEIIVE